MCKVYLVIALLVMGCKYEVKPIGEQVTDAIKVDTVMADSIAEETRITQIILYEGEGRRIYLEKGDNDFYCYIDSQRVVFNDYYMDDGIYAMSLYSKGRYIYIAGDMMPNSNGWIERFHLYRINTSTFEVRHLGNFAAIHFENSGFKAATARLLNPDAKCTAEEIYAIRSNYYNYDGVLIRKGKKEYDNDDREREYGDTLVNAVRIIC